MAGFQGLVTAGRHRISVAVSGHGGPAVVIEPAFGGSAQSWQEVAAVLAAETTVATYDRAAYGASSRAMDHRAPADIARDLHEVLGAAGVAGPFVLVGHSFGGVCVRAFAGLYDGEVAGMVLVDSSHEAQEEVLRGALPWYVRLTEKAILPALMMGTRSFRSGADRRSIRREYRSSMALTAADQILAPDGLGRRPLAVITRGPGRKASVPEGWRRWHHLNEDLARLSANSRHGVADDPGHYVHKRAPGLVTGTILDVLRSARTGGPLEDPSPGAT
jgi:pimeloyl-ACP methyl ester carboxylesterase